MPILQNIPVLHSSISIYVRTSIFFPLTWVELATSIPFVLLSATGIFLNTYVTVVVNIASIFSPPHDVGLRITLGLAVQSHVARLTDDHVRRGVFVHNPRRNWKIFTLSIPRIKVIYETEHREDLGELTLNSNPYWSLQARFQARSDYLLPLITLA